MRTASKSNFFKLNRLNNFLGNHKGYIAGGCFKNIFTDGFIRDIDFFFESEKDYNEAVAFYKKESKKYSVIYENANCKAFKMEGSKTIIECVKTRFGSPKEMIDIFDFTICKMALYSVESNDEQKFEVVYSERFFEDLQQKKLVIDDKILLPFNTFERSLKYTKYGFGLCRESKLKLLNAIRESQEPGDLTMSLYNGMD